MPDLCLVLEVGDEQVAARQHPGQTTPIRRRDLEGRRDLHGTLVHGRGRLVHHRQQDLHELVRLHFAVLVLLHRVVKEDVTLVLVEVGVLDAEVLLGLAPRRLVDVKAHDGLEELQHLDFGLVPHGGAAVDHDVDLLAELGLQRGLAVDRGV